MPILSSKTAYRSGVPLGGIGAGKIEVLPSGVFNAFTFLNNWGVPVSGNDVYPGVLGYHLGVFTESAGASKKAARQARLLQTVPVGRIPTVSSIRYEGLFPNARLEYAHPSLPVQVALEAWSPWVPGDAKDSALPAVYFRLIARNRGRQAERVSFLFMGRNLCGEWCVGRQNRIEEDARRVRLIFSNTKAPRQDGRRGQAVWSFEKAGWKTSFVEQWNAVTKNFYLTPDDVSLAPWPVFAATGALPDLRSGTPAIGENREPCGAVAASTVLGPGQEKSWPFMLAWDFPGADGGHYRRRWFKSAAAVTAYAASRRKPLEKKTRRFRELVLSLPFPAWFNDALLTNLAPFFAATRRLEDGRFAFYEAPVICPLMGTVDVGFYGSIPLAWFFPELERSQLLQFARAQSPAGYVPHDLGRNRLDCPSAGTTFYEWKDLNPKFVLMAWRDYVWSGDRAFLTKIYPHVKRAVAWSLEQDADGNGLPDHEGADQTFDLWDMRGTSPYTAGLFLAALLAARRMASLMKDARFAADCAAASERGRASFIGELWNGRFFGREYCALSQLNGQWYADLLGLGDIADAPKIRTAIRTLCVLNSRHSRFGLVNSVRPDGRLDTSNPHSRNIWNGMNYAFLSLALMRGFPMTKVLKDVYKIWNNTVMLQKNPWNQPDMVDSKTGRYLFGDAYYRNMAIWSIPMAYAKTDKKTAQTLIRLRSIR